MILIITLIDIESGDEGEQADCDDEDMNLLDELGKLSKCQKENFEEKKMLLMYGCLLNLYIMYF